MVRMAGIALVALALVASACGKDDGNGSGGTTTGGGTSTSAPQESGATSAPATTGQGSGGATVAAANVGTLGTVLVDSSGFTLYHLEGETTTTFTCTGGCEQSWPPLEASGEPTAGDGASGELGTAEASGRIHAGHLRRAPALHVHRRHRSRQANGQGVQNVWFALTPAGENATGDGMSGRGY
jgi:predicted lipoprotein with Yx(FWY)xxD motif